MDNVPKDQWCTCESASGIELNGYPPKFGDAKWLGDPSLDPRLSNGGGALGGGALGISTWNWILFAVIVYLLIRKFKK